MIKKRVLHNFIIRRNGDEFDEAKVWFGLNAIKVRDLRGRISGGRRGERHQLRDERGVLHQLPAAGRLGRSVLNLPGNPCLSPPGQRMMPLSTSSKRKIVTDVYQKRKTILIRQASGRRRVREAEIDIYEAMLNRIEDFVFPDAEALILKNFEHELKFRVFKGLE
ncbi:hypothetical protein O5552_21400 [Escherichia coli]|nr:hypothetical protein [Escherichia coli]